MPPTNFQPRILTPEEVEKTKEILKHMYSLTRDFDQSARNLLKAYELGDFMALHNLVNSSSRDQRAYVDKLNVSLNLKYPQLSSGQITEGNRLEELATQPGASQ